MKFCVVLIADGIRSDVTKDTSFSDNISTCVVKAGSASLDCSTILSSDTKPGPFDLSKYK